MKGQKREINFIVFDRFMRYIEINSTFIEELQRKHPDQFKIYQTFKRKVFEEENEDHIIDLLNNE